LPGWPPRWSHYGRQPGDQRIRTARRPGEQDAHAQVGHRELQQEQPEFAGGQHQAGLHREHKRGNRQQARHGPGRDLPDDCGQPDYRQPGHQAGVAAIDPASHQVGGYRQADGLGQAPARRQKQSQRPGEFQIRGSSARIRTIITCFDRIYGHWYRLAE
jgi:hypothetical protein